MDDRKLETFLIVAREGSFTKAAEHLYISSVAVKKQIDALEDELSAILFVRSPSGCTLTNIGSLFYHHAETILHEINHAKTEIRNSFLSLEKEIIVGHNIHFNHKFAGGLSTHFSEVDSDHILQFLHLPRNELISKLSNKQIHCVFAEESLLEEDRYQDIEFFPLISLDVYAIMKKNHPLSNREKLSIEDLKGYELYSSILLRKDILNQLNIISKHPAIIIEETDRYNLFNSIIKNAIQIYPNSIPYHISIPLEVPPVILGIYTLKNSQSLIRKLIDFSLDFINNIHNPSNIL